ALIAGHGHRVVSHCWIVDGASPTAQYTRMYSFVSGRMVASAAAAARSADVIQHAATTHTERRTFQASRLVTTISVVASATATMTAGCENHRSAAPVI